MKQKKRANSFERVCPYCTPTMNNLPLNKESVDYSMLEVKIIGRGQVLRVRNLTPDGLFDGQDMMIINYCPICGKNLQTGQPAVTTTIDERK